MTMTDEMRDVDQCGETVKMVTTSTPDTVYRCDRPKGHKNGHSCGKNVSWTRIKTDGRGSR